MNYDLGSKPDEGAGPIERVVLQEDPFEDNLSYSEGSNDRAAGPSHADSAATEGNSHSSPDDDDRSPEAKDASSKNVQAMESGVLQNGVIGGRGNGRGSRRGESVVEEDFLRGKKTLQHLQEEYWGNGYRAAREGSPRTPGEGAGWVSPSRPPRLTVDLINIDPVKEAVIHVSISIALHGSYRHARAGAHSSNVARTERGVIPAHRVMIALCMSTESLSVCVWCVDVCVSSWLPRPPPPRYIARLFS